ncbi:MAG: hypothetical protein AB7E46_06810 [Desulfovibrio sp.]
MRITGYGSGFGRHDAGRDRAAAFRARHSVGQRIKGRILRREPNGLYWVQVGGEDLLARLEVQAVPGDELLFIVRALTPEIMLQALAGGMSAGDLPGLVQRFRAAREVFEANGSEMFAALQAVPPDASLRREAFQKALEARPDSAANYAKVLALLTQINSSLGEEQTAVALYQPWLLPVRRRQEMLRRDRADGGAETSCSAVDPVAGAFELRLRSGSDAASLVLTAERPEACGPLQVEIAALVRADLGLEPVMLGPSRLRRNNLGGVLGELFGDVPSWSSGGLNTRV